MMDEMIFFPTIIFVGLVEMILTFITGEYSMSYTGGSNGQEKQPYPQITKSLIDRSLSSNKGRQTAPGTF